MSTCKIRQEINILNHGITSSSVEYVNVNPTVYSGTVTYYFELVGLFLFIVISLSFCSSVTLLCLTVS